MAVAATDANFELCERLSDIMLELTVQLNNGCQKLQLKITT